MFLIFLCGERYAVNLVHVFDFTLQCIYYFVLLLTAFLSVHISPPLPVILFRFLRLLSFIANKVLSILSIYNIALWSGMTNAVIRLVLLFVV